MTRFVLLYLLTNTSGICERVTDDLSVTLSHLPLHLLHKLHWLPVEYRIFTFRLPVQVMGRLIVKRYLIVYFLTINRLINRWILQPYFFNGFWAEMTSPAVPVGCKMLLNTAQKCAKRVRPKKESKNSATVIPRITNACRDIRPNMVKPHRIWRHHTLPVSIYRGSKNGWKYRIRRLCLR